MTQKEQLLGSKRNRILASSSFFFLYLHHLLVFRMPASGNSPRCLAAGSLLSVYFSINSMSSIHAPRVVPIKNFILTAADDVASKEYDLNVHEG